MNDQDLWYSGYGYAVSGDAWPGAVAGLRRDLGRDPTAFERAAFGRGFVEGQRDLAAWESDMERMDDDGMRGAIALAMPWRPEPQPGRRAHNSEG